MMNVWGPDHTHTLVDKVAYDKREAALAARTDENGDPRPEKPAEFGLQMVQRGFSAYLCHLSPTACGDVKGIFYLVQGCHVLDAVEFVTSERVAEIVAEWNLERSNPV